MTSIFRRTFERALKLGPYEAMCSLGRNLSYPGLKYSALVLLTRANGDRIRRRLVSVTMEAAIPGRLNQLSVELNDDQDDLITIFASGPLGYTCVGLSADALREWFQVRIPMNDCGGHARIFSLRVFDHALWWKFGVDPDSGRWERPWYVDGNWHPFGLYRQLGNVDVERRQVIIPMVEFGYRATAVLSRVTHGFEKLPSRFWKKTSNVTITMEPNEQIPVPGDDSIFSFTTAAESIEDAIGKFVASCLRSRRLHGGSGWVVPTPAVLRT